MSEDTECDAALKIFTFSASGREWGCLCALATTFAKMYTAGQILLADDEEDDMRVMLETGIDMFCVICAELERSQGNKPSKG